MASTAIGIPALRFETPLTAEDRVTPDAHRALLALYNANPLIPVSTANGNQKVLVPYAKKNQGVEITYIKISADANIATLVPSPAAPGTAQDQVNFGTAGVAMGAAQGSRVKLKSDGKSNWYVTG